MRGTSSLVLLAALCVCGVVSTDFMECKDYDGKKRISIKSVEVSNCPSGKVCNLVKGENATITVEFEAKEEINQLNLTIHGVMRGMKLPYPGSYNKNGCSASGLTCPIPTNEPQVLSFSLPVNKNYPNVPAVDIRIQLDDIGCFLIPAAVVKGRKE